MAEDKATGALTRLVPEGEDTVEALIANRDLLDVFAAIHAGRRVVGAYEIYANPAALKATIADGRRTIWLYVAGVFAALYLILLVLVGGASRLLREQAERLRQRARQLTASHAELESSALEAIETLNATVEARDPYTGGHSKRVKDMSGRPGSRDGLSSTAIPEEAAIICLVDAWDAMTSDRPYRLALDPADAVRVVVEGSGTQFAPAIVDAFVHAMAARTDLFGSKARSR